MGNHILYPAAHMCDYAGTPTCKVLCPNHGAIEAPLINFIFHRYRHPIKGKQHYATVLRGAFPFVDSPLVAIIILLTIIHAYIFVDRRAWKYWELFLDFICRLTQFDVTLDYEYQTKILMRHLLNIQRKAVLLSGNDFFS